MGPMGRADDGYETVRRFWEIQDGGDYTRTAELFADDAVLVDPVYGVFEGREAIAAFMARMNAAVGAIDGVFTLEDLAGGPDSAWARWRFSSARGEREGVGIYRVRDGRITYYRDYMDPPPAREDE